MKDTRPRNLASASPSGSLATTVVEFCRFLNGHGISVPPGSSELALRALGEIDVTRRAEFRRALRVSLLKRPQDIAPFTDLFNAYWRVSDGGGDMPSDDHAAPRQAQGLDAAQENDERDETGRTISHDAEKSEEPAERSRTDVADQPAHAARWGVRTVAQSNDRLVNDPAELERIARALAAELAMRRSRRKEPHPRGKFIDHRNLMRKSLRYGGVPIALSWRRARITRAQLLIFCDVSRSMEPYARLLLHFAAAVLRHAWRVEVFLFASRLMRVTGDWLESDWSDLTRGLADCGGGTEIGTSLEAFLRDYDYCLTGNKATTIVLSDGLDAGEPAQLGRAMAQLSRRSRRVIWLNPLLATEGYEPTARGMAAALPYVDVFAPADDVTSLWRAIEQLRRRSVLRQPA